MANKNYVGNGKTVTTKYGDMYNISISKEKLNALTDHKGYVRLTVSKTKEADKYGNDLTVFENDYKKPESPMSDGEENPF